MCCFSRMGIGFSRFCPYLAWRTYAWPTINHKMLNAFVERWHSETFSFYLPHGEMSITFDDVSCLLHLPIRGRFLNYGRITKDETLEKMVDHLGTNLGGWRTSWIGPGVLMLGLITWRRYTQLSYRAQQADGDDEQVAFHKSHASRAYMLYLVDTSIFMDKSATYTNVVYLRYFVDFERIHKYN